MRRDHRRAWLGACVMCTLRAAIACDSRRPLESRGAPPASFGIARPPAARALRRFDAGAEQPAERAPRIAPERGAAGAGPSESVDATDVAGSTSGPFIIDSLIDVAAAGPVTAT